MYVCVCMQVAMYTGSCNIIKSIKMSSVRRMKSNRGQKSVVVILQIPFIRMYVYTQHIHMYVCSVVNMILLYVT